MQSLDLGRMGFVYQGDYNVATQYQRNDVVKASGNVYSYISNVPSTGSAVTDTSKWAVMMQGLVYKSTYAAGTQYSKGDMVAYNNTIWACDQASLGNTPQIGSNYWSSFSASTPDLTNTIPVTGNVTVTKGALHQVTATTADLLVPLGMGVGEWFQVVNYGSTTGVIVRTNGLLINGVNDDVQLDRLGCVYTFKYISAAKGLTISC